METSKRPMDDIRKKIISVTGLQNVYIDPPADFKMKYPCIRLSRTSGYTQFASNMPYIHTRSYRLVLIDYDPDSEYYDKIVYGFPMIRANRHYVSDGLHMDDFTLYSY